MIRVEKVGVSDDLRNWFEVYEGVGILFSSRFCMFVYCPARFWPRGQNPRRHRRIPRVRVYI